MVDTEFEKESEEIVKVTSYHKVIERKNKTELLKAKKDLEEELAEVNGALGVFK